MTLSPVYHCSFLLLIDTDHCRPGTPHKSCSFGDALTSLSSSHHNLALVKVAQILHLPIFPASNINFEEVQTVNQLLDLQDADLVPALNWLQCWFGICQAFSRGPSGVYSTIDPSSDSICGCTILDGEQELLKVWLNKDDEYDSTSQSGVSQFVILSDDMMNSPIHSSHMTLHTALPRRMSRPNAACQSQRSLCRRSVPQCCMRQRTFAKPKSSTADVYPTVKAPLRHKSLDSEEDFEGLQFHLRQGLLSSSRSHFNVGQAKVRIKGTYRPQRGRSRAPF
ncbi:hypothetical protein DPX16_18305 [Anabarilius grahami]|uniref:Uncharacterized protein n=1 Tax=Anabarilius grahami TaxID=495550 RepID=A0A3N0YES4_ANAGA|nr:hypothetical protein DPX16_18305 [Anabarilius grahami]